MRLFCFSRSQQQPLEQVAGAVMEAKENVGIGLEHHLTHQSQPSQQPNSFHQHQPQQTQPQPQPQTISNLSQPQHPQPHPPSSPSASYSQSQSSSQAQPHHQGLKDMTSSHPKFRFVPRRLRPDFYFDFASHPFDHAALFFYALHDSEFPRPARYRPQAENFGSFVPDGSHLAPGGLQHQNETDPDHHNLVPVFFAVQALPDYLRHFFSLLRTYDPPLSNDPVVHRREDDPKIIRGKQFVWCEEKWTSIRTRAALQLDRHACDSKQNRDCCCECCAASSSVEASGGGLVESHLYFDGQEIQRELRLDAKERRKNKNRNRKLKKQGRGPQSKGKGKGRKNVEEAGAEWPVTVIFVEETVDDETGQRLDTATFNPASITGRTKAGGGRIYLEPGAKLVGCHIDLTQGDVYIGAKTIVDASASVQGPAAIGCECHIRTGAKIRGNCILGDSVVFGGEMKTSVLMDQASFPHQCYLGDSICGFRSHFGNGATSANLGIFEGTKKENEFSSIELVVPDEHLGQTSKQKVRVHNVDTGTPKLGIIMGDYSQVGCNSVSDPGTFLAPWTMVYSLTAIRKGFYGPYEVIKNKPFEAGVVQRSTLDTNKL